MAEPASEAPVALHEARSAVGGDAGGLDVERGRGAERVDEMGAVVATADLCPIGQAEQQVGHVLAHETRTS